MATIKVAIVAGSKIGWGPGSSFGAIQSGLSDVWEVLRLAISTKGEKPQECAEHLEGMAFG